MPKYIMYCVVLAILSLFSSCAEQEPISTRATISPQTTCIQNCIGEHSFADDSDYCCICGENYYSATLEMELSDTGEYYIVTGMGKCTRTVVRIPESYNNLPVTVIGEYAFAKCAEIAEVILPSTVKEIGECAFVKCKLLQTINFPQDLISIGSGAFSLCMSLESVAFGNQLSLIGDLAFYDCVMLNEIYLPDSVVKIGENAFSGCTKLTKVILSNSVSNIEKGTFKNCTSLTSINIPGTVNDIAQDAFAGCQKLQYNIYEGMAYLGDATNPFHALMDRYDPMCKVLNIHNDTKIIASKAFRGTDIEVLIVGENLVGIGWDVLPNLGSLVEIRVSPNNPKYHAIGNCLIETATKMLLRGGRNSVIPNDGSVTSIGKMAFAYVAGMTSIVIPDTIVSIEANAFIYCVDLEEMIIGSGVQFIDHDQLIGADKFSRCYYRGDQNQWDKIDIVGITSGGFMGLNTKIKNAIKYFYSETQPTEPGNYWHYVDGIPTPWETEK